MNTAWGKSNMKEHFPLNLQLFADEGTLEPEPVEPEAPVTYTQEEFDKALQRESDRRVTSALKTAQEKWQKEFEEKLEREKSEAEELAKLSATERERKKLEKERKQLESDRAAFDRDRLELQVVKELANEGLDARFSKFLMGADAETSNANIQAFKEVWATALESAVKERLGGRPPQASSAHEPEENPFAKETFNLTKQAELLKTNPELYKELKNRTH